MGAEGFRSDENKNSPSEVTADVIAVGTEADDNTRRKFRGRRKGSLALAGVQSPTEGDKQPNTPPRPGRWGNVPIIPRPSFDLESPWVNTADEIKKPESAEQTDVVIPTATDERTQRPLTEAVPPDGELQAQEATVNAGAELSAVSSVGEAEQTVAPERTVKLAELPTNIWARRYEEELEKVQPIIEEIIKLRDDAPRAAVSLSEAPMSQPVDVEGLTAAEAVDEEDAQSFAATTVEPPGARAAGDSQSWSRRRSEASLDSTSTAFGMAAPPPRLPRRTAFGVAPGPIEGDYLDTGFSGSVNPNIPDTPPANVYTPPAPQRAEAAPGGSIVPVALAYIAGRYFGRKKEQRITRPKLEELRWQNERTQTNLRIAQAEQRAERDKTAAERNEFLSAERRQQIQLEHNEAERRREQAAAELRLRDTERQRKAAEMRAMRAEAPTAPSKHEAPKDAEVAGKAPTANRLKRSVKARFERFQKLQAKQEEPAADTQQLVAGEGNSFERHGLFNYEVTPEGRIVNESQTVLKHGKESNYERAPERGIAGRGRAAGGMALIASVVANAQKTNASSVTTNVISTDARDTQADGTPLPYNIPSASTQRSIAGRQLTPDFSRRSKANGPLWPYLVALIVIVFCLFVLL